MKLLLFALIVIGVPHFGSAQCEAATISPTDTVKQVRARLVCYAMENERLKKELAATRSPRVVALSSGATLHVMYGDAFFNSNTFTPTVCKNKAIESARTRGGTVFSQGDLWIQFRIGGSTVLVNCRTSSQGSIITAGPDEREIERLRDSMRTEIFP